MNKIELDAGEDWEAFLGVCEQMGGRGATQPERDRLYDCWLADTTCREATRQVLGVTFGEGLVHISTPLRSVEQKIREARSRREIEDIMADAIGRARSPQPELIVIESVPTRRGHFYDAFLAAPPVAPTRPTYVPLQRATGWRGGRRAELWWMLIALAATVPAGFLVATIAAVTYRWFH